MIVLPVCKLKSANLIFQNGIYLSLCISVPICKKHTLIFQMNSIYSCFFFWVYITFVAIMVWLTMASTPVFLQLHSPLSIQLNNKRSSTSLTWGKGSHYLNAFHDIIHIMLFLKRTWSKLCINNSLEKMFCWKKFQYSSRSFSKFYFSGLFQVWIFIFEYFPGREASSISRGQGGQCVFMDWFFSSV